MDYLGGEGDFNDIRHPDEKCGRRTRTVASCQGFLDFITRMNMEDIEFQGRNLTWVNNWKEEGYIEARLDIFFWCFTMDN